MQHSHIQELDAAEMCNQALELLEAYEQLVFF